MDEIRLYHYELTNLETKAGEYEGLIAKKRHELEKLQEAYNKLKNPSTATMEA